jgi:anti-sigma B factor antagonist
MARTELSSVSVSHQGVAFAERDADRIVVWLRGEHDASTVVALSETMARAIALDDADVVVDLSGVHFMGAATVGVIIRAGEFLRLRSRSLVLRSPSRCARRILDVCGLANLLDSRPVDATRMTGAAGALGTWVEMPASDPVDRRADASTPKPGGAEDPVRADHVASARELSSVVSRG